MSTTTVGIFVDTMNKLQRLKDELHKPFVWLLAEAVDLLMAKYKENNHS